MSADSNRGIKIAIGTLSAILGILVIGIGVVFVLRKKGLSTQNVAVPVSPAPIVRKGGVTWLPNDMLPPEKHIILLDPKKKYPKTAVLFSKCNQTGTSQEFTFGTHNVNYNRSTMSLLIHAGVGYDIGSDIGTGSPYDTLFDCKPNSATISQIKFEDASSKIRDLVVAPSDPINLVTLILHEPELMVTNPDNILELGVGRHTNTSAQFQPTDIKVIVVPQGFQVRAFEVDEKTGPSHTFGFQATLKMKGINVQDKLARISVLIVEKIV